MRYIYVALILLATSGVLVLTFQNLDVVTVAFLSVGLTLPTSLMVIVVYLLGMFTGGFVVALLRGWLHRATEKPE
jgi:uncharacterized integral membrane protein